MKKLLVLCTWLMTGTLVWAQPPGGGPQRQKIESMKVAYLTQQLDLSPEEAQKFWPVYNKYNEEMEKGRRNMRSRIMEEGDGIEQMSNAEAEKALNDMLAFRASEVETLKKYTQEFKKVLSPQKVLRLFVAEQQFKHELLRMLKEKKGRGGPGGPPPPAK